MEIQIICSTVAQDQLSGGYASYLILRNANLLKKKTLICGRYWRPGHTSGSMYAVTLTLAQILQKNQTVTILNNPYCSIGSFGYWRLLDEELPTAKQGSMKNLVTHLSINLKNRYIDLKNPIERTLYYTSKNLAQKCSELTCFDEMSHFICPKCHLDFDPKIAQMFGWECSECFEQALIEI